MPYEMMGGTATYYLRAEGRQGESQGVLYDEWDAAYAHYRKLKHGDYRYVELSKGRIGRDNGYQKWYVILHTGSK